jgi:hypothetical protein
LFLIRILFNIEILSPDLLDAYDAEYERINQLYQKRKPVIDAYEKWLSFWNDFVAFTVIEKLNKYLNYIILFRNHQLILVVFIYVVIMQKLKVVNEKNIFVNYHKLKKNF